MGFKRAICAVTFSFGLAAVGSAPVRADACSKILEGVGLLPAAQKADPKFVSWYAAACPKRLVRRNTKPHRDIAETDAEAPSAPDPDAVLPDIPSIFPIAPKYKDQIIPQHFFARADALDNPAPGFTAGVTAGQALGASFSYSGNDYVQSATGISRSGSVTATGLLNYVPVSDSIAIGGNPNYAFIPSLQITANGNWDTPKKAFGDTSALKFGPDLTFRTGAIDDIGVRHLYTELFPFYQTDFYGRAKAEGATASLFPVVKNVLGETLPRSLVGDLYGWTRTLVELRGSATYLNVDQAGQTNLLNRRYAWLGGEARAYVSLFPSLDGADLPTFLIPYLQDRIVLVGTYKAYVDAYSGLVAHVVSAAGNYKLACRGTDCVGGSTTLGIQYDYGTDRDTLQKQQKVQAKLSFAY